MSKADIRFTRDDKGGMYITNIVTGKTRKLTSGACLLVEDSEIDYEAISRKCPHGIENARVKAIRYAAVNTWDGFKDGYCAISWMLYPDGMYFADSDGYGMESNDEEVVYAIMNENLEIIEPFRPIEDVAAVLAELRKKSGVRIFNLIIIDESGSMQSIKKAAIDSVNETIQSIRAAARKYSDQEHMVSLVTFHDDVTAVYECVPVEKVKELDENTYQPKCCTALYDAMGMSLNALRPKVGEGDKVLVTVVTDGYENASKEYSGKAVKALVDELKAKGWVFAYIGANQDVEAVAATLSITNVLNFEATDTGTAFMSDKVARSRTRWFCKISQGISSSIEDNCDFFSDDVD